MATNTILPISQSLYSKVLNERNPMETVFDVSGGFNTLTQILELINKTAGGSKRIDTYEAKYEFNTIGNKNVVTQIQSNAASGSNLVLTFNDPNFDQFRLNDEVMDSEQVKGYVIATAPGTITIAPGPTTTFSTATHFTANMYAKVIGDASANRFSGGKSNLFYTPDTDYNYSKIMRDSSTLARRDMIGSYVKYEGKYWYTSVEPEMIKRVGRLKETSSVFGERGQATINGQLTNLNGGLIWSIKNRNGNYFPATSTLTEATFRDLIGDTIIKNATRGQTLTLLHGTEFLKTFQGFTTQYIQYAGASNTFGVTANSGLNVKHYSFAGVNIDLIHLPIFDDPKMFPEISSITGRKRQSGAFLLLDLTPIPSEGNMGMLPAIEKFHFGEKEMFYGYVPGMISPDSVSPNGYMSQSKSLMANDLDGFSCHTLSDSGINIADAKNMLYFEYAS